MVTSAQSTGMRFTAALIDALPSDIVDRVKDGARPGFSARSTLVSLALWPTRILPLFTIVRGRANRYAYGHAHELEGPERAIPADAFEPPDDNEVASVPEGMAQLGGESRRQR